MYWPEFSGVELFGIEFVLWLLDTRSSGRSICNAI